MNFSLNSDWVFSEKGKAENIAIDLPSCNYTAYLAAGRIPDPFYKTNEKDVFWVAERDYTFSKTFVADSGLLSQKKIFLSFARIDTLSEIYLNERLIARTENAHRAYELDVTESIREGENTLVVNILSSVDYINKRQKETPMPINGNGLNGANYIRKPGCHFGWDWGPCLPPSGLGNVEIKAYSVARIKDFQIKQTHENGQVSLEFLTEAESFSEREYRTLVSVFSPDGEALSTDFSDVRVEIEKPELWWANGMTEAKKQPLYTVVLSLEKDGEIFDSVTKKIGLRTLELYRENGDFGFVVNGRRVFAKGANWIPIDSFVDRRGRADYEYYIKASADCNMNMLRVWGGGYYECEDFYDLCDEYGIMVWQDFAFACMPYPFYEEAFLNNVMAEVEYNLKRLRHRASLAVLCGNNEIESMAKIWIFRRQLINWTGKFFYGILKKKCAELAPDISYTAGSPVGSDHMKGIRKDTIGDTHLWQVWHGLRDLKYYRKRYTRFCSEFGLESLPSMDAIRSFATAEDFSLYSEVFNAHQKCINGNEKMLYYLATRYNIPKDFEDIVYFTQLIQKECVSDASDHWRRNFPYCNGSLFWQLNDCWPVSSWASIDYTGKYKALQYHAKSFFAPLGMCLDDHRSKVTVYLLNDTIYDKKVTASLVLTTFDGKELYREAVGGQIPCGSTQRLITVDCRKLADKKTLKSCVFSATLYEDGKEILQRTTLFAPEKNVVLPREKISVEKTFDGEFSTVTLKSNTFQRSVMLDIAGVAEPFSDNYFDLLPGKEKIVTIKANPEKLTVKSIADTDCDTSKLKNLLVRMKIARSPMNVLNALIYFIAP